MIVGRRRAFTLVEMIVATLLLAIGVVAALTAFSTATTATRIAGEIDSAALLARRNVADLSLRKQPLLAGVESGDFGDAFPGFGWQRRIEATKHKGLYLVDLTVHWGDGANQRTRRFTTYVRDGASTPPQPAATPTSNDKQGANAAR